MDTRVPKSEHQIARRYCYRIATTVGETARKPSAPAGIRTQDPRLRRRPEAFEDVRDVRTKANAYRVKGTLADECGERLQ